VTGGEEIDEMIVILFLMLMKFRLCYSLQPHTADDTVESRWTMDDARAVGSREIGHSELAK
jgi:hypothetical protein